MRVINRFRLRDFAAEHPRSEKGLRAWFQLMTSHDWDAPEKLQATFPSAQVHENLTAFDIQGGSYFVITSIDFDRGRIFLHDILIHTEFRTGAWKQAIGSEPTERSYVDLTAEFPLRPIQDEEHLHRAAANIDVLLRCADLSEDEQDYLDVLALIIEDYERRHITVPPVAGSEILRILAGEHRLSQTELIPLLGSKAKAVAVLKGTRPLELRQVSRASRYFKLPPEVFMNPDGYEADT